MIRIAVATLTIVALSLAPVARAQTPPTPPRLVLHVGFGGTVSWIGTTGSMPASVIQGFTCKVQPGDNVLVSPTRDANGTPFCIIANANGLSIAFNASLAFTTSGTLGCTSLSGAADGPSHALISVVARIGYITDGQIVYNGARAKCDIAPGFAYALAVESPKPSESDTRTLTIPWSLLHLGRHAASLLLNLDLCPNQQHCGTSLTQFVVPLAITEGSESLAVTAAAYVHLETPTPGAAATPFPGHDVEVDAAYNWDRHDLISMTFAQNQSYVAAQRALSQALSLAPVAFPATTPITVTQTLQTQSQSLFAFQMPSDYLEDSSLKPLFDILPFTVSRSGSLSSGYAYGYTADNVKGGAFYGNQARGWYSGGATLTLALPSPTPSPNPSPTPTPVPLLQTGNVSVQPLKPPPPPAPFFESGTASVPPAQISLVDAFSGSRGTRDNVDALAFETHVYQNASSNARTYRAETVNLYGRFENDQRAPIQPLDSASSQFVGESTTFTSATNRPHPSYFQIRETVAAQADDMFFGPSIGSATWLAPLDGPVAHVTASYASGPGAKYVALDLLGFRLTNVNGDIAAQMGWQVSLPLPSFFRTPGWILTGGGETQTLSDRIAALAQGDVNSYAVAVASVVEPAIRPQRLGNVSLLSPWVNAPWLGGGAQLELVGGYNFGTVTGCGALPSSKPKATQYACLTTINNRGVGGLLFKRGRLGFGATDTSTIQGNVTSGAAARNLGTSGALPGSTTAYLSYTACPTLSAAYTNAAFPSGVPFPQQGSTLSAQADYPLVARAVQFNLVGGYFSDRVSANAALDTSGVFLIVRMSTPFKDLAAPCKRS